MSRYFIEVAYNGSNYSGFQIQQNANSVQSEIEKALTVFFKTSFELTGSSRTDAGVHALQNFFHFDTTFLPGQYALNKIVYNLNAILPEDIVVKSIKEVLPEAHCRFDAKSREYHYFLYANKDPFISNRAYFFPYTLDLKKLNEAAETLLIYTDFTSFAKKNTQVKTFNCQIFKSSWVQQNNQLVYIVQGNRFLRGMVRGLVGTMLKVGTGKLSVDEFKQIIENKDATKADFSVPGHGLFLVKVEF